MTEKIEIKDLLERYFAGETSLEDEQVLKNYFTSSKVLPELKIYAPLFAHFTNERQIVMNDAFLGANRIRPSISKSYSISEYKNITRYILLRAAAVLFLVSGAAWFFLHKNSVVSTHPLVNQTHKKAKMIVFDGSEDPKLAFEAVKSALVLTSNKMKKGTEPMDEGLEKMRMATTILK